MQNIKSTQHELLKTAIEATDAYLGIEKQAQSLGFANASMNQEFTYHIKRTHDALNELGVFGEHREYIESHIQVMIDLTPETKGNKAEFKIMEPVAPAAKHAAHEVQEAVWDQAKERAKLPKEKLSSSSKAKAKARARAAGRPYPNMVDNIWAARQQEETIISFSQFITEEAHDDEKISEEEIDKMVDELEWEDIVDLYDDEELMQDENGEEDEDEEEDEKELQEKLSVQARLKKRQAFARMRGKRNTARNLKLRRPSSMNVLKKRAVLAARRAVYKRFLRGRDKSTLSAAEKDRIEQQVSRMKYMQAAIATKMLPKMRSIEQKRLAGYRTKKPGASGGSGSKAPGGTKPGKRR